MRSCAIRVTGRVQGVFFRHFTQQAAFRHNICGWAKNMPDGSVAIQASGEADDMASFQRELRTGPPHAVVQDVEVRPLGEDPGFTSFEVLY